ncbi:MAG: ribosomal RNA small subunit methyltransferase A [Candidatus Riflebacteria bacterium]|nr:ribosomal RNA small subunit methyltransferase A [Candidatus Riflebacteria bacterium]
MKVRDLLDEIGIQPKKSLGQNFCVDERIINSVLNVLKSEFSDNPPEEIWEIGPGLGSLTEALFGFPAKIKLFEIDQRLRNHLESLCKEHRQVEIHWGDFLLADFPRNLLNLKGSFVVCGNLPYFCGTAIVRKLVELDSPPKKMVFVLQKEVSKKASALPGSDEYGFLSVAVQLFADAKSGETFSSSSFFPNPKISSALLILTPFRLSDDEREIRKLALNLASVAFSQRRKKMLSVISKAIPLKSGTWIEFFDTFGISRDVRAEELTPEIFIKLAQVI